jgi:hypothetical protein
MMKNEMVSFILSPHKIVIDLVTYKAKMRNFTLAIPDKYNLHQVIKVTS